MSNLENNPSTKKSNKSNDTKIPDLDPFKIIENQEKIVKTELPDSKNLIKDYDHSKKKENDNDIVKTNNPREIKVINVELSNDEKFVYSQLGINPLVKLGKEYLTSNNLVRLENGNSKDTALIHNKNSTDKAYNKKENKKVSTPNSIENIKVEGDDSKVVNPDDTLSKIATMNEEIKITEEIDNPRRKRRRSSANIE